jgi:hypothetical protein
MTTVLTLHDLLTWYLKYYIRRWTWYNCLNKHGLLYLCFEVHLTNQCALSYWVKMDCAGLNVVPHFGVLHKGLCLLLWIELFFCVLKLRVGICVSVFIDSKGTHFQSQVYELRIKISVGWCYLVWSGLFRFVWLGGLVWLVTLVGLVGWLIGRSVC